MNSRRTILRISRRRLVLAAVVGGLGLAALAACDHLVGAAATNRVQRDVAAVSPHRVGLVLGTARQLRSGAPNPHYRHRIAAAAALYHGGKVSFLLVSGDNSRRDYDEPTMMRDDLIAAGVPADRIVRDYAGFRTLDSVVRAREVFGVEEALVISQEFHVARALYLGDHRGLRLEGFAAADATGGSALRVRTREVLARTLAVFDVLLARRPKFLGPKIAIDAAS